jgi:hypothetical protein
MPVLFVEMEKTKPKQKKTQKEHSLQQPVDQRQNHKGG